MDRTKKGPRLTALASILMLVAASCVSYRPRPESESSFRERVQSSTDGDLSVSVAVPSSKEATELFGVSLYKHGIQPVWLEIENRSDTPFIFQKVAMDAGYFPPGEAAYMSRFKVAGRLARYVILSVIFLPALPIIMPIGIVEALRASHANDRMAQDFDEKRFPGNLLLPGDRSSGFVFTGVDEGTKHVEVVLFGPDDTRRFSFFVTVPGVRLDHHDIDLDSLYTQEEIRDLDEADLREALRALPCCTTNKKGDKNGDPVNLVVVGEFEEVLAAFTHAKWDETEVISGGSAWRTVQAFVAGSEYRISPVSNLHLFGRPQDIAFQKARSTIHQRHHFRLWYTPMQFEGRPVWAGAATRDIGVRFTTKTWNLTTHAIDADVDEARGYITEDLIEAQRLKALGVVGGVGRTTPDAPRRNLTGDPFYTDGYRSVYFLGNPPVRPDILDWDLIVKSVKKERAAEENVSPEPALLTE